MKFSKQNLIVAVLAALLIVGAPFWFARKKAAGIDERRTASDTRTGELKTKIDEAGRVKKDTDRYTRTQAALRGAMPETPDIDGAIRALNSLASKSSVIWKSGAAPVQSIEIGTPVTTVPTAPGEAGSKTSKTSTPSTTIKSGELEPLTVPANFPSGSYPITVSIEGQRSNIMAFLNEVRTFDAPSRLFVVDDVQMSLSTAAGNKDVPPAQAFMTASITLKVVSFKPPKPGKAVAAAANEPGTEAPAPVASTVKK